jgi:hypothetical protein
MFASPGLVTAAILLSTWSLMTFVGRAWIKLRIKDGWSTEDSAISVAFVRSTTLVGKYLLIEFQLLAIFHVATTCVACKYGYGEDWESVPLADQFRAEKVERWFAFKTY